MNDSIPAPPKPKRNDRSPASRWTPKLAQNGWTPIADDFLDCYAEIVPQITPMEALLVVHLMRHKWDRNAPYPGFVTLAKHMGLTPTSVRNHARSLEKKGYLTREMRVSRTNRFHLDSLFSKLEKHVAAKPAKPKRKEIEIDVTAFE